MVSCLCAEQSFWFATVIAVGVVVAPVSELEFVQETAWAFARPATPNTGVASDNVKVELPSIHANVEFVCVVSVSPQQYCVAVEFANQTVRRTFLSRSLLLLYGL